jgi:hypothetical protein
VDNDARACRLPFYRRTLTPLDIALMHSGRAREDECEAALVAAGGRCVTTATRDKMGELVKTPWDTFIAALATAQSGEIVYGREVLIEGPIGAFDVGGAIDFVILMWEGRLPILRLVECKASRRDRTCQRVQVAIYGLLVRAALAALPLIVAGVRLAQVQCVVARIEEATNTLGDLLTLPPLDLTVVEDDVVRFLAPDGHLYRIYMSDEDALEFQLDPKCDTCTNNSGCLAEAARKRQVQLIGCSTTTARILHAAGVTTIDALADLDLAGAPAQRIRRHPDFTEDLAVLQRRAQVRRTTLPGGKHALPVLPSGTTQPVHEVEPLPTRPLSQLPAHEVAAPEPLVRVFLEVSYDYVEDRIDATAAHITASPHQLVTPFVATTDPATGEVRWTPVPEVCEDRLIRVETRPDTGHAVPKGEQLPEPCTALGTTTWSPPTACGATHTRRRGAEEAARRRAAASNAARSCADSCKASASRCTVSFCGVRCKPRSRSLIARTLMRARSARASCVRLAASR